MAVYRHPIYWGEVFDLALQNCLIWAGWRGIYNTNKIIMQNDPSLRNGSCQESSVFTSHWMNQTTDLVLPGSDGFCSAFMFRVGWWESNNYPSFLNPLKGFIMGLYQIILSSSVRTEILLGSCRHCFRGILCPACKRCPCPWWQILGLGDL